MIVSYPRRITDSAIDKLSVDLGMHDKDQGDALLTKMVSRLVIHKGWMPTTMVSESRFFAAISLFNVWLLLLLSQQYNDIAILTLDSPVTYTSAISPFCLPPPGLADRYVGSEAAIIGWGDVQEGKVWTVSAPTCLVKLLPLFYFSSPVRLAPGGPGKPVLQQATVQIAANMKCRKIYPLLAYSMLCAGAPGRDTCQVLHFVFI